MKKFEKENGLVLPLDRANVDTDYIIPKQFLKSIKRTGFGKNLFDEATASDVLARGEADAAMIVASDPMANFSQPAREHLASIPYIALDPKETPTTRGATVAFAVATYGINVPGTVYRMDDVPIPLRPAFESPHPSDFDILKGIQQRVRELKA